MRKDLEDARKNLEALLRGYVLYRVNGKYYGLYSRGKAARQAVPDDQSVRFSGFSIWRRGWRVFYQRAHRENMVINPAIRLPGDGKYIVDRWQPPHHNCEAEE